MKVLPVVAIVISGCAGPMPATTTVTPGSVSVGRTTTERVTEFEALGPSSAEYIIYIEVPK